MCFSGHGSGAAVPRAGGASSATRRCRAQCQRKATTCRAMAIRFDQFADELDDPQEQAAAELATSARFLARDFPNHELAGAVGGTHRAVLALSPQRHADAL